MSTFSERMGFSNPPEFMQMDGMTQELENLLFNFCVTKLDVSSPDIWNYGSEDTSRLEEVQREINTLLKKKDGDFRCGDSHDFFSRQAFLNSFGKLDWHQKYSLCEYLAGFDFNVSKTELNGILERENSGYRLGDNCQLIPISNQHELKEVANAQCSQIETVAFHMNKAVACFADREKPDYDNSIKEAVSALEALAQKLTGRKGTLGQLVKSLNIHPSLRESISRLYGFTSDGGIRHAKKEGDQESDFETAKFVIVTASAMINYLSAQLCE